MLPAIQMTVPDISKLIDQRIKNIWDVINHEYDISLQFHDEPNYLTYSTNKTVVFYIERNNYCKDSFAHEVLHTYFSYKQINIGSYLILRFRENLVLSDVFSPNLIEHISNTLDHTKMLDIYLHLGFDRTKFIVDYTTPKCTSHEISLISSFINSDNLLWKHSADLYLGKFFAIKACPNNEINYTPYLEQLQQINTPLYYLLDKFWNTWLAFDIEKYNLREYNYWNMCDEFYNSLLGWTLKKLT